MSTQPHFPAARFWSCDSETVTLVLRYYFHISDDRFNAMDLEAFDDRQRGAGMTQGKAWDPWQVLLVCRAWRAAGERGLYETVVVRSLAQAHALMDAFRTNRVLGGYVRRLRLEGAYGVAGSQIIHFVAATVSDLWLNVIGLSSDMALIEAQGTALSSLNPRTLTIFNRGDDLHEMASTMRKFLAEAIPHWSHLRHVTYSFEEGLGKARRLYNAIGKSTVEIIEVPLDSWGPDPRTLKNVLHAPRLHKVISYKPLSDDVVSFLATTTVTVEYRLHSVPSFSRQFPKEVLDMVIGFAVIATKPRAEPWFDRETAGHLLTVSLEVKDFTLAHISRRPYFRSVTELAKFNTMLASRPKLAQRLVAVDLAFAPTAPLDGYLLDSPRPNENEVAGAAIALNFLATRAPNLRVVKALPTRSFAPSLRLGDPGLLLPLAPLALASLGYKGLLPLPHWALADIVVRLKNLEVLDGITLGTNEEVVTSVTLERMTKLRRLVNTCWPSPSQVLSNVTSISGVFSQLRELEIRYSPPDESISYDIWPVLTDMDLPMLTHLGYYTIELHKSTAFFEKHGAKLSRLAFGEYSNDDDALSLASWCFNVTEVEVWDSIMPETRMDVLPSVLRLTLNVPDLPDFKKMLNYTLEVDTPSQLCPLPNLREVLNSRLPDWKNLEWQSFSDELRDKGMLLLNYDLHAWRPRLRHPDAEDYEQHRDKAPTWSFSKSDYVTDYRRRRAMTSNNDSADNTDNTHSADDSDSAYHFDSDDD